MLVNEGSSSFNKLQMVSLGVLFFPATWCFLFCDDNILLPKGMIQSVEQYLLTCRIRSLVLKECIPSLRGLLSLRFPSDKKYLMLPMI